MEITFLGTGGVLGVPVWSCNCKVCKEEIKKDKRNIRTRPSILVTSGNKRILVDTGPDFRAQMLREGIKKIDYVLLTHIHMDHSACLMELRAGGKLQLEIPKEVYEGLKENRRVLSYLFARNPDIKIDIFKPKKIGNLFVEQIKVKHKKDYSEEEQPTFGFLFIENGYRVAYIPDFSEVVDKEKVKGLDIFICDGATLETKWGHIGIKGGIKLYKELKPKLMIFTHLNHSHSHKELEKYVSQFGNIKLAYDGLTIKAND
ncbi:MBL fold metallo-hydrolase [Patescibacteria group bacterium]|nr:MBL fold metallo-hydrolase [Patescibacteria group bacterium]